MLLPSDYLKTRILLTGDDISLDDATLERIFRDAFFPVMNCIKEVAILNASEVELYAIKWAKKLNIPYIGFLYNAEAALDYADLVITISKRSFEESAFYRSLMERDIHRINVFFDEDLRYEAGGVSCL